MIKNSLKYTKNYYNLSEKIKLALEFLESNNLNSFANGKYQILGDDIYVNIQDYNTKPEHQGKWEAHRNYIDIQYMIEGTELIGVGEIHNFNTLEPYDEEKDVEFLSSKSIEQFVRMSQGDFIILYPYDVHMPQIVSDTLSYVKKAVIKVCVDEKKHQTNQIGTQEF